MGLIGEIYADVGLRVDSSGLSSATSMFKAAETSLTGISNVASTTSTNINAVSQSASLSASNFDYAAASMSGFQISTKGAQFGAYGFKDAISAMNASGLASQSSFTKLGTIFTGLGQKSVSLSDSMGRMNTVMLGLATGALVSAFSDVISVYVEFDDQMRKVQAVTEATGEQFSALTKEAKQLGADTSFTAREVAEGMTILGQAGWNANEVMETIPGTLDLARSSMTGLSTSVDIMTTTMVGFQMEADESGRAADVLAKAANISATDVTGIGEAMKYTSSLAHEMNWSLEETTAAVGLLSNAGIKSSMAGTVLRNSITRLISPTKQVVGALEKYGISLESVNPETHSLAEIIDVLSASGMSAGDVMKIFGMRAGPGMLALLSQGSGALRTYTSELENAGGYAEEAADKMDAGLGGAIRKLQGAFETFQITVGEDFAYTFTTIIDITSELIDIYQYIPSSIRKVGTAFAALATGGLVVVTTMGTLGMLISAATPAFAALGITAASVSGILSGMVIPAAVITGLIALDEKTGIISDTLSFLYDAVTVNWYAMKNIIGGAIDSISGYISDLISDFNSIGSSLHLEGVTGFFSSVRESISGIVSSVHEQAEEYRDAADDIETNIFDASSGVKDAASTVEKAHDVWGDSAWDLAFNVEDAYGNVTGSVSEAQSEYQEAVDKFLGDIDKVTTAGIEVMSGVDINDLTRGIQTVDGELLILNDDLELVKISADGTITPLKNMGEQHFQTTSGGLTILTQGANDASGAMSRADTLVGKLDQDVVVLNGRTLSGINGEVGNVDLKVSDLTQRINSATGTVSILDSKTLSNLNGQINGADSAVNTTNSDTVTWGQGLVSVDSTSFSNLQNNQSINKTITDDNNTATGNWGFSLFGVNGTSFETLHTNLSISSTKEGNVKTGADDANSSLSTLGGFSFSTTLSSLSSIYNSLGNIYDRAIKTIEKLKNIGSSSGSSSSSSSSGSGSNKTTTNNTTTNNVTIKTYATESNVTKWVKRAVGK